MAHIKLNDIVMYYETHGDGPPIVFISGFSADHTVWRDVVERFKASYRMILFDNRGAGQTSAPDKDYTIDEMANDVVMLCSHLGIRKATFVGNSMGGFILQSLARNHPQLVESAIISNSAANARICFNLYLDAQLELLQTGASIEALVKASLSWVYSYQFLSQRDMFDRLVKLALDNPYPFRLKGYRGQYAALKQFNSQSWLKQIQVPTLVLGSDYDLIFNEPLIRNLAENIPGARYHQFTQCGHIPALEYPDEFYQVVHNFITLNNLD